jgi:hypothetical protein
MPPEGDGAADRFLLTRTTKLSPRPEQADRFFTPIAKLSFRPEQTDAFAFHLRFREGVGRRREKSAFQILNLSSPS